MRVLALVDFDGEIHASPDLLRDALAVADFRGSLADGERLDVVVVVGANLTTAVRLGAWGWNAASDDVQGAVENWTGAITSSLQIEVVLSWTAPESTDGALLVAMHHASRSETSGAFDGVVSITQDADLRRAFLESAASTAQRKKPAMWLQDQVDSHAFTWTDTRSGEPCALFLDWIRRPTTRRAPRGDRKTVELTSQPKHPIAVVGRDLAPDPDRLFPVPTSIPALIRLAHEQPCALSQFTATPKGLAGASRVPGSPLVPSTPDDETEVALVAVDGLAEAGGSWLAAGSRQGAVRYETQTARVVLTTRWPLPLLCVGATFPGATPVAGVRSSAFDVDVRSPSKATVFASRSPKHWWVLGSGRATSKLRLALPGPGGHRPVIKACLEARGERAIARAADHSGTPLVGGEVFIRQACVRASLELGELLLPLRGSCVVLTSRPLPSLSRVRVVAIQEVEKPLLTSWFPGLHLDELVMAPFLVAVPPHGAD